MKAPAVIKPYPYKCGWCPALSKPVDRTLPRGWIMYPPGGISFNPMCPKCKRRIQARKPAKEKKP